MNGTNSLRILLILLTLNFFFIISSKSAKAEESVKPYRRAMYFPGGVVGDVLCFPYRS
jgi:hypothetical protein